MKASAKELLTLDRDAWRENYKEIMESFGPLLKAAKDLLRERWVKDRDQHRTLMALKKAVARAEKKREGDL